MSHSILSDVTNKGSMIDALFEYNHTLHAFICECCVENNMFHNFLKFLTARLLKQSYRYHKLRKVFSKLYRRHYELISKFNVELKSLLYQGLSKPEFYGGLIYKLKKIMGRTDVSDQFRKIIIRHKHIGFDLNVMRQSACLLINPITVDNFAALFNCTPVDRASDSMMALI